MTQAAKGPNRKGRGKSSPQKVRLPAAARTIVSHRGRDVMFENQRVIDRRIELSLLPRVVPRSGCFAAVHCDHLTGDKVGFG